MVPAFTTALYHCMRLGRIISSRLRLMLHGAMISQIYRPIVGCTFQMFKFSFFMCHKLISQTAKEAAGSSLWCVIKINFLSGPKFRIVLHFVFTALDQVSLKMYFSQETNIEMFEVNLKHHLCPPYISLHFQQVL